MAAVPQSDVFAIAMLAVIFCSFGVVGLLLWSMKRKVARRDRHVDQLLEELEIERNSPAVHAHTTRREAWEKNADWWKNS